SVSFSDNRCNPASTARLIILCREAKVILEVYMATTLATQAQNSGNTDDLIGYEEAMNRLSREERFRATVYAMNTLLVQKGIYSPEEFELQFRQFAQKNLKQR